MPQPMDAYTFFNSSGCLRYFWTISGALGRSEYRQLKTFTDWPSLSSAIEKIESIAFYRILLSGLKDLYDLDFDELDENSLTRIGEKLAAAYKDRGWYRTVLKDKTGLDVICQDSRGEMDRSLFSPVARMDDFFWFGRPGWREKVIEKYGTERTSTLEGLVDCLREEVREAVGSGAVSIKSNNAWSRMLNYEQVSEHAADDALAESQAEAPNGKAIKVLGDYIMDRIADLCAEHDLPLQIHTGPAMGTDHYVDYGNPLHLNSIILRHPETRFVIFHAGGPFVRECAALAGQFPNVYLDLCGVLGRTFLRNILEEWIELVPHNKLMWGTDVNLVEEAYAITRSFRTVLADFLMDRVESGYLTPASAESFARGITSANARRALRAPSQ